MNTNHAADVDREHELGRARTKATRSDTERWSHRIAAILALAEDSAKRGDEAERDRLLEQASALQLKFAIADTMLRKEEGVGAEQISYKDFCTESNTPLIKVKRQIIQMVAEHCRGRVILMGEMQVTAKGLKMNKRAKMRVWAHESDLQFITAMYTSLLTQMQTMMANDETHPACEAGHGKMGQTHEGLWHCPECLTTLAPGYPKIANAWRVSYGYGWSSRVYSRLLEIKARQENQATSEPGTALVLRDRTGAVSTFVDQAIGKTRKARMRHDDKDEVGRAAGYVAGGLADLGQTRVRSADRCQLGS